MIARPPNNERLPVNTDKYGGYWSEFTFPWLKWFSLVQQGMNKIVTTNSIAVDSATEGLILKDTAGTYWQVKVSTAGALTITKIGNTLP